jgi:maleate cis-trans isomerase
MRSECIKIGFLGSSAPSSPHHESFRAFIPADVAFTFVQEIGARGSLYDAQGKVDALVAQARDLIAQQAWNGVIISGAPKEALNPGMWERVCVELPIPAALALRSSVAALKAFSAKRVLLMTPVDQRLKSLYTDYLARFDIESFPLRQTLGAHTDALKLTPQDVEAMTHDALAQSPEVDAVYFQGALLDPLPILDRLEADLRMPVVASNPAMLWLMLSKLGRKYQIPGYGKLLSSWPDVPSGPF